MAYDYELIDILYYYKNEFIKSFEFIDVQLETTDYIFTHTESHAILNNTKDKSEEIEKLFFILKYARKDVANFLEAIKIKYYWLYNDIADAKKNKHIDQNLRNYQRAICNLRDDLSKHTDSNVHRLDYV